MKSIREKLHIKLGELTAELMQEEGMNSGDLDLDELLELAALEKQVSSRLCALLEANGS